MPVPSHIARRLREVLGAEVGGDLVTWMEDTSAVRADLAAMNQQMQVGFTRVEANLAAQLERTRGELLAQIERSKSDLMKWSFVFWVGAVGAIAALAGVLRG